MKLIVMKSNFKDCLGILDRTQGESSGLPILKNALLEAADNQIKITATNLEVGVSFFISGKVIEGGRVTVPISVFSNIINNLQSERLNFESKGATLTITTDNYEASLQSLPAEDFPLIPKIKKNDHWLLLKGEILSEALEQILPAAQGSDLRPELSSVLMDFTVDSLKLVATDSFRLSEKTVPAPSFETNHKEAFRILVPLKTAQDVAKVVRDDDEVHIFHDDHQVFFKTKHWECISRLIEGNFPDYNAVLPKGFGSEIVVDRQELINAVKLAGVLGSKVNEIKIVILENKHAIEIYSVNQGVGENRYILPAKISGGAKEAAFNWRYLSDGLRAVKTADVYLGLQEENKAALLKSPADASFFYILMPIFKA